MNFLKEEMKRIIILYTEEKKSKNKQY